MRSNGLLQGTAQRGDEAFDFGARCGFGYAEQRMFGQLRIGCAQNEWADDFFAQEISVYDFYGTRQLDRKFVEKWRVESAANSRNFLQLGERELRFREVLMGHLAQAFFAEKREVDRGGEGAKRLIGANVGCGFLAADVLFASR